GPTRARGTRGGARHGSCPPRRRNHRPSVEMVETRTRRSPVFVRNVLLAALCTASLAALPDMVEAQSARAQEVRREAPQTGGRDAAPGRPALPPGIAKRQAEGKPLPPGIQRAFPQPEPAPTPVAEPEPAPEPEPT